MNLQPVQSPPAAPPGQAQWMAKPGSVLGCPPGLEYLTSLDQVLIHQQVELFEVMTGWDTKNRYAIKNSLGQQCYFAYEESETCHRMCCGSDRGFVMHVVDNLGQEVLRAEREFKCCVGCCCCISGETCAYIVNVQSPVGTHLGRIIQLQSKWKPIYAIQDANNHTLLRIKGPCCVCHGPCCPNDVPFNIFTLDGEQNIGSVSRQFAGFTKEMFTNATNFGVTFPMDLDVKAKALLLSATFLIDMMFFEDNDDD